MSDTSLSGSSFGLFFLATTFFIVFSNSNLSNRKIDAEARFKNSIMYSALYGLGVVLYNLFMNLQVTKSSCGTTQWGTAVYATLFPWVLIFGILMMLLELFPGWLTPFSNTFGYLIASFSGVGTIIDQIFKPSSKSNKPEDNGPVQVALSHIYGNKSLLINEITTDSFDNFWSGMSSLMLPGAINNEELKDKLFSMVALKESAAKWLWYILGGALVTSVSLNYIVNSACSMSTDEMKARHDEYEETIAKEKEDSDNSTTRVYSTTE